MKVVVREKAVIFTRLAMEVPSERRVAVRISELQMWIVLPGSTYTIGRRVLTDSVICLEAVNQRPQVQHFAHAALQVECLQAGSCKLVKGRRLELTAPPAA